MNGNNNDWQFPCHFKLSAATCLQFFVLLRHTLKSEFAQKQAYVYIFAEHISRKVALDFFLSIKGRFWLEIYLYSYFFHVFWPQMLGPISRPTAGVLPLCLDTKDTPAWLLNSFLERNSFEQFADMKLDSKL